MSREALRSRCNGNLGEGRVCPTRTPGRGASAEADEAADRPSSLYAHHLILDASILEAQVDAVSSTLTSRRLALMKPKRFAERLQRAAL